MADIPLSSWLFLLVVVFTIVDSFFAPPFAREAAMALLLVFIARELSRTPRMQVIVGSVLTALGLGLGWRAGDAGGVAAGGLKGTLIYLVLFGALAWVQTAAAESRSLQATRDAVLAEPPGRRYLIVALAAETLGAFFNLASLSLLSIVVSQEQDRALKRHLAQALAQGFSAAACWAPFFVGTTVILSMLPQVRWVEVAPFGFAAGLIMIAVSWLLGRLSRPAAAPSPGAAAPSAAARRWPGWARRRLAAILGSLFFGSMALVEFGRLSIPVALGLMAPPFAVAWTLARGGLRRPSGPAALGFARRVVGQLHGLRSEAVLFASANVFGAGIAASISPDAVKRTIDALAIPADARVFLLTTSVAALGAMGLHPLIIVVVVGHVLPPDALGVSAAVMALALMTMWGVGTCVSPFSATSLYMSRITGEASWTVAWRLNGPYALAASLATAAFLVGVRRAGVL